MSESTEKPAILIVEDEQLITELLQTALEEAGFSAVLAADADEAFAILERDGADIIGLVTDINLGSKKDGWDVARHAREQNAAIAVVYCSGANPHEWATKGVPQSVVLTKPFAAAQAVVALSNLINAANPGVQGA